MDLAAVVPDDDDDDDGAPVEQRSKRSPTSYFGTSTRKYFLDLSDCHHLGSSFGRRIRGRGAPWDRSVVIRGHLGYISPGFVGMGGY